MIATWSDRLVCIDNALHCWCPHKHLYIMCLIHVVADFDGKFYMCVQFLTSGRLYHILYVKSL